MRAYCINLDWREDRLQHMAQQFHLQGISFERISAIDGNRPEIAIEAMCAMPTTLGPRISNGAYGCFQSHRKAWGKLLESGEPHALILEDDMLLAKGFATYLSDEWVQVNADIVRLETFRTRIHVDGGNSLIAGSRRLRRLRSSHLGAGCYVISAKAAGYLYDRTRVIRDPVDVVLFSETSELFSILVTYQMVPAPTIQGKRDGKEANSTNWEISNIEERFDTAPALAIRPETSLMRLRRRFLESFRALHQRTCYIVVPFR